MMRSAALLLSILAACDQPVDELPPSTDETQAMLQLNNGSPGWLLEESRNADEGAFRAVMQAVTNSGGCTATVIAPYLVATAYHCVGAADMSDNQRIRWSDVSLPVGDVFGNPYAVNKKYFVRRNLDVPPSLQWENDLEYRPFPPRWLLDDYDDGDRIWGRAFDVMVKFVPGLTPEFLEDNGIEPVGIEPYAMTRQATASTNFTAAGWVGASASDRRQFGLARFAWPNPDNGGRQRGSYKLDLTTNGLVQTQPGDSGAPIMLGTPWLHSSRKLMVAANSNTWTAPTMVLPGYTTPEQADAVRLNSLWLKARIDDPDGDGLPNACDANPAGRGLFDRTDLCPDEIGFPVGDAVEAYPEGSLMCPTGYVASGIRGQESPWWGITHELAVRCTNEACFDGGPCDTVWTDTFGGLEEADDTPFTHTCPDGQWMTSLYGDVANFAGEEEIISMGVFCSQPHRGWPLVSEKFGASDAGWPSEGFVAICPDHEPLRGMVAHSRYRNLVTGIVPVCRQGD